MNARVGLWLWPNLLSLDAPVVALLWQVLFVRCFHASLGWPAALLLAMAVWLIYAADRMLDAWRGVGLQARHYFYLRHWRGVGGVWLAIFAVCVWTAWTTLSASFLAQGIAVAIGSGLYLTAVHAAPGLFQRPGWKEGLVSVLFAIGASLAAWSMVQTAADVLAIALFCVLCWMNCAAIEDWEAGLPVRRSVFGAAVVIALSALWLSGHRPVLAAAETASVAGLVFLDRYWSRLTPERMRVLADVVLLTPVFFLQLAGTVK